MTLYEGAELGATTDKTALIRGDVGSIQSLAETYADQAAMMDDRHDALKAVRVPDWSGQAADAWEATMGTALAKWLVFAKMLRKTGEAMSTYASALSTAQGKAQDAIDKYAAGDAATASAVTKFNQQVDAYNAAVQADSPTLPPLPGVFVDPGAALRQEAQEILDDARAALDDAGGTAVSALGGLPGSKSSKSGDWMGAEGNWEGPSIQWDFWDKKFGDSKTGDYEDKHDGGPVSIKLGSGEGDAWVWKGVGDWEDRLWGGKATADGEIRFITADGSFSGTVDKEGLVVNADGTLTLIGAKGDYKHEWEHGGYGVSGEAAAEASAEVHANATKEGVHVGGEVFAGGKAGVTPEVTVLGVTVKGTAEGWYGGGGGAHGVAGWDDGKLKLGGSGGLALGLGGKLGGEVTIDVAAVGHSIADGGKAVASLFD